MSVQSTTEQAASGLRIQRDTEIASPSEKSGIRENDDEAFARLIVACRGVPHLATCIYETLKSAGLSFVLKASSTEVSDDR